MTGWAGELAEMAGDGRLVDLSTYLDQAELREQLGDRTVESAVVGEGVYWLPLTAQPKGIVWYRKRRVRLGRLPGAHDLERAHRPDTADDRRRPDAVVHRGQ